MNSWLFDKRGKASAAFYAKKACGCVVCGLVALRRVGTKGYCKKHLAEALQHNKNNESTCSYYARKNGTEVFWE